MTQTCGCSSGDSRWSLKGTTALVTGGTKGIGLVLPVLLSLLLTACNFKTPRKKTWFVDRCGSGGRSLIYTSLICFVVGRFGF